MRRSFVPVAFCFAFVIFRVSHPHVSAFFAQENRGHQFYRAIAEIRPGAVVLLAPWWKPAIIRHRPHSKTLAQSTGHRQLHALLPQCPPPDPYELSVTCLASQKSVPRGLNHPQVALHSANPTVSGKWADHPTVR